MKKTYTVQMRVTASFITEIDVEDGDDVEALAEEVLCNSNWNDLENMSVSEFDVYTRDGTLVSVS